jgi:hypothetical protein
MSATVSAGPFRSGVGLSAPEIALHGSPSIREEWIERQEMPERTFRESTGLVPLCPLRPGDRGAGTWNGTS